MGSREGAEIVLFGGRELLRAAEEGKQAIQRKKQFSPSPVSLCAPCPFQDKAVTHRRAALGANLGLGRRGRSGAVLGADGQPDACDDEFDCFVRQKRVELALVSFGVSCCMVSGRRRRGGGGGKVERATTTRWTASKQQLKDSSSSSSKPIRPSLFFFFFFFFPPRRRAALAIALGSLRLCGNAREPALRYA